MASEARTSTCQPAGASPDRRLSVTNGSPDGRLINSHSLRKLVRWRSQHVHRRTDTGRSHRLISAGQPHSSYDGLKPGFCVQRIEIWLHVNGQHSKCVSFVGTFEPCERFLSLT